MTSVPSFPSQRHKDLRASLEHRVTATTYHQNLYEDSGRVKPRFSRTIIC